MFKKISSTISVVFLFSLTGLIHICSAANYDLEVPIGGQQSASTPAQYLDYVYTLGLILIGIAALAAVVFGGFVYLTSGGNQSRAGYGKDWISGAVMGLFLLLCSYLILNTINPDLLNSDMNISQANIIHPPHTGLGYNYINSYDDVKALPIYKDASVAEAVKGASEKYGVPEDMVWAVMGVESGKEGPLATSPKGAQGLMQLMPGTARDMGVTDPYDPVQNIYGGTKYLSIQYNKYGNWTDALGAYNAGPGRVDQYGGGANIPYKETQQYIAKIQKTVPQHF